MKITRYLLIFIVLVLYRTTALPNDANLLLTLYIQNAGGIETIEKIKTLRVQCLAKERNQELDVELQIRIPDRVLFHLTAPNGMSIKMGFTQDGRGWRDEGNGSRPFEGEMAVTMYRLFLGLMPQAIMQLQSNTALAESTVLKTNGTSVVKINPSGQKTFALQFDETSGLLVGVDKHQFDKYQLVEGVQVPHLLRDATGFSMTVKKIQFNVALDNAEFNSPVWSQSVSNVTTPYQTLTSSPGKLEIVRKPAPMVFNKKPIKALPKYNPNQPGGFTVDLRGSDCTQLILEKEHLTDLMRASFDSKTRWPAALPAGFEPDKFMALGKNPGLKLRQLHHKGITGKGIGIGIIDQTLLVDHCEYRDRLKLYEEIHNHTQPAVAMMHGPAVASIAAGKTVGVAPEADLYYIAETHGEISAQRHFEWDFTWVAKSIDRMLEINQSLPAGNKIRVISISVGWSRDQKGFTEANEAVKRASAQNIFVISTTLQQTHGLFFHGLGRKSSSDPDDASSYIPGSWWAESFFDGRRPVDPKKHLLVPMDSRCVASPTGPDDYVYYAEGGWSWSVPYLAGLYALACQVQPTITPEQFWSVGIKTGKTVLINDQGKTDTLGTIADPVALIENIGKK